MESIDHLAHNERILEQRREIEALKEENKTLKMSQQFNYLAVDCGYVDRLEEHVDDMEFKPLFFKENCKETNFSATKDELEKFKKYIYFRGAVVFKCSNCIEAIEIVKMLQKYDHTLEGFSLDDIEYMQQNDDILIMKFDTSISRIF